MTNNRHKPTSAASRLGFSFAIIFFALIIGSVLLSMFGSVRGAQLIFLTVLISIGFCIASIILCIIGLSHALRNNTSKWMSIAGLTMCIIAIISIFIPMFASAFAVKQPEQIQLPEYEKDDIDDEIIPDLTVEQPAQEPEETADNVVIYIDGIGRLKCIDNRPRDGKITGNMWIHDYDIKSQIKSWLKINNISPTENIELRVNKDAEYDDFMKVLDALKSAGYTKYTLFTGL